VNGRLAMAYCALDDVVIVHDGGVELKRATEETLEVPAL